MTDFKLKKGINVCSNAEYHGDLSHFSSSQLKLILKDPEKFHKEVIMKDKEVRGYNPAFAEGTYAHSLILEPELVDEEFIFFDGFRRAGKDWKEFQEENKEDKRITLTRPQKQRVERWVKSYENRSIASELIKGGVPEETVVGDLLGIPLKARADYINIEKGYIVDVKTTAYPTDVDTFQHTMTNFGYQLSAALYSMMFAQHYKKKFDFYFIVLGKKESTCDVYKLSEESYNLGESQVLEAIKKYKNCLDTNDFTNRQKSAIVKEDDDYEILSV